MPKAPCLMVQGTGSGVGKSVLATALCRIFARAGFRVAPFKAQNMSLNAAVTSGGGEIGRAQAVQAEAAGVEPTVDMNPLLLKPEADDRSQLVVRGVAQGSMSYREYARVKPKLLPVVEESLDRLRRAHDLVIIEGAGSPAEINLRESDLTNMAIARLSDAPVLLVGDIDRGGTFASLVGTMELLEPGDRGRVAGFIINKFRGDASLLAPGIDYLFARTGVPVLGVVPYFHERLVPDEDSLSLSVERRSGDRPLILIAVVRLPRISNFDDFEPLGEEPGVAVRYVERPGELRDADLIILPGTKTTALDLECLRTAGLAAAITERAQAGVPVIGICGGFQMLGTLLHDPHHVESSVSPVRGLGLLPVETTFLASKTTTRVVARVTPISGPLAGAAGAELSGYEIHMGRSDVSQAHRPFVITERQGAAAEDPEGAVNAQGNVLGSYLHGLFGNRAVRRALLSHLAERKGVPTDPRWGCGPTSRERYERLADLVEASVDLASIAKLIGCSYSTAGERR